MNLQCCKNGHYFDASLSQTCPHCAKQSIPDEASPLRRQARVAVKKEFVTDLQDRTVPIQVPSVDNKPVSELNRPKQQQKPMSQANAPGDKEPANEDPSTQGIYGRERPVVGWLVCTSGLHYGKSYPLHEGRNTIGRGSKFSVPLENDLSVSRTLHAVIVFDPKENRFFAVPGDANELCYLNDTVVLTGTAMQKNDRLNLGKTQLMLIPCCDAAFCWNGRINQDE